MRYGYKQYCKDFENIENYEKAKKDDFKGWLCHHRLETHTSDGERRLVDITVSELQALDMYYNRPSSELIFLTRNEHKSLHKPSDETKKKISDARKGKKSSVESKKKNSEAHKGKHLSEETKKKISDARKGKPKSTETRKKMGAAKKGNSYAKGMHFFNNGKINIRAKECPDGFVPGRIKKL